MSRPLVLRLLHHVKENTEIMENRAGKNKEMPNGMHIAYFFEGVEYKPRRISDAAG